MGKVQHKKNNIMEEVAVTGIVFFGIYSILRLTSEHFLKRKIINSGHIDKAGILAPPPQSEEVNKYPSLKWALVAFYAGMGLIIIEVIRVNRPDMINFHDALLPLGIELVFVALGFLSYFYIANRKR